MGRRNFLYICPSISEKEIVLLKAQLVELVDTLVSGTSVSNDVKVRVLYWAPPKST